MKRPLLYCILAFLSGIFLGNNKFGIAIVAILFILCEIYCYLSKKLKKSIFFELSQFFVFLFWGCVCFGIIFLSNFNFIRSFEVKKYDNKEVEVIGIVNDDGIKNGVYWQYILKDNFINGEKIKSNILIKTPNKQKYGSLIRFTAVLELPKSASNSKLFDYCEYLKTLNIYITAKVENISIIEESKLNFLESTAYLVREKVREFTSKNLNNVEAGILNALIIGDDSKLEDKLEENYKKAGMLHLLVVSGGHTVFLIMLLKFIFGFFETSKNLSKIIYILVIVIYIFITGATSSILRAGIGIIIVMISSFIGRQNDSFTTMGIVALLLILNNPNTLFSLSFLLSFGGVLGIIICYPRVSKILEKIPKVISEPLALTISAQLFVTPITIYSFNTIYFGGIISNIFSLNLSGIIMMLGIILFILYLFFPPIIIFPMKIVSILIFIMNKMAEVFGNIEWMTQYVITPNIISIILYYILLFYVFIEQKSDINISEKSLLVIKNKIRLGIIRNNKKIIIGLVIFCMIIFNIKLVDFDKNVKISVIDVGHGDSILITTPNDKHVLIDTGDKYYQNDNVSDMGEKTIIPYLLKRGIKNIDLLVLTHMDSDHIGGFDSISKSLDVKMLGVSINSERKATYKNIKGIALNKIIDIRKLERGDTFVLDKVEFKVLLPQKNKNIENENNDSIVLLMKYKDKKALFMGDLEEEGEEVLLKLEKDLDVDILKVGHHGSATSSTDKFIKETSPQIALISVGNRFKSVPGKDVLERLSSVYSNVYRTDKDGEINVIIDNNDIKVETTY